ncbi:hypothetical protein PENTCL1PPCAC_10420, partial [Pristionchus entomophagus]
IRHDDVEADETTGIHLSHSASVRLVRVVGGSGEDRGQAFAGKEVVPVHHHLMAADDEMNAEGIHRRRQYILPE